MRRIILSVFIFLSALSASPQVNTDRVMTIGKNALYFEDYVLAIQYFNQVIGAKPYLAEPYYFRAMAKFMLDDFKGAEEDANLCINKNSYYTAAYQLRGAALQNQDKFELAAADYQRSLESIPEDRLTLINMAIVNVELKDYEIADKFFEVLLRRFPNYAPGYLARAQMNVERKDTLKAMADYDKAIETDPYAAQSFSARSILYFQQHDYNKALADLDEAIRLDPYFTGNYINRGLGKYNLNDLRGAMADYDRVIEMDENNLIAGFNRGLLRAQVADNNRAIKDFDKVIKMEPKNTMAYLNRAMLYTDIGDNNKAIEDMNVVLKEHPDFFTGYYMRSEMKRKLNDLSGAEQDFNLARAEEAKAKQRAKANVADGRKLDKKSKDTREETDKDINKFNLLMVADKKTTEKNKSKYRSESRGRVQDLTTKVVLEPKFVLTYYDKGFEVNRPVYFSESIEKANRTLNLNRILKAINNEAALNESQAQLHFGSIDNFSRLIARSPNDAKLYFGRGMDFMLVQDYENSLKDMDKAIELQPDFLQSYFARAVILTKQLELAPMLPPETMEQEMVVGENPADRLRELPQIAKPKLPEVPAKSFKYDAIVKDYETILRLDSGFIYAYYNMAEIYSLEKNYRAAIDSYNKAIKIEPQFAEAYFNRGLAKLSIGETASGLDDLRKAGELGIVEAYSIIKRMK